MKKITITLIVLFFLITLKSIAQTITTGDFNLSTTMGLEYSAKIQVSNSLVTLTLVGPDDRWLGIGLGVQTMTQTEDHGDVLIYDGTTLSDRHYVGFGLTPAVDTVQDWTVISNVVDNKIRTIVATRAPDSGDIDDYVFSTADTSVDLVWARGNGATFSLSWHGSNRGITMASFHLLGLKEYNKKLNSFEIVPNPSTYSLNLKLFKEESSSVLEVFDVLGKKIYADRIHAMTKVVNVSQWNNGVYLVRLTTDSGTQTKRFVKQ